MHPIEALASDVGTIPPQAFYGRVHAVVGLMIEVQGLDHILKVGSVCSIEKKGTAP